MSHVISTRLKENLYSALERIADTRQRSFSEIVQDALQCYVEDYADYKIAVDRLHDHTDEIIDSSELERRLGWHKG